MADRECTVDLKPYMNPAPYSVVDVSQHCPKSDRLKLAEIMSCINLCENVHVLLQQEWYDLHRSVYFFQNTSLPRVFKLFRGLGLRHLVVVDLANQVSDVIL